MAKLNEFESAIKENGFTIIDGVKYALDGETWPDLLNNGSNAHVAWAFTSDMSADEAIKIAWIDNSDNDEYQGSWEKDAFLA